MAQPDLLLTHGVIHTMDAARPLASALAIRDGRVLAAGGDELRALAGPGTRVVNLEGRCVIPGLTDSHIHFAEFALLPQQVNLVGTRSLEEMLARVAERARSTPPGEWLRGHGWDQELWAERRFPTAADLDRAAPHHPTALTAKSGHALVANSAAMQRAGIGAHTPDPRGGRIVRGADGQPTGLLLEEAGKLVYRAIPEPPFEVIAAALPAAFAHAWRVGLTAIHDVGEWFDLEAYRKYASGQVGKCASGQVCKYASGGVGEGVGGLGLRVVKYLPKQAFEQALALWQQGEVGDDWVRLGGVKLFADGALGTRTAAMLEPYAGEPDNLGILTIDPQELEELARRATAAGLPLAVHAIGDRANRLVLDALERAGAGSVRHRIEHVQLIHPSDLPRLAALGIVASMQPIHAPQDAPMADRYWGARVATAYAWRSLLDAGTVLACGSDCPVEDLNPFLGIAAAVTRTRADGYGGPDGWRPEQRLTVEEAVRGYTLGPAFAAGMEERLGSLSPGKWADLIVLDRDIFSCDPAAIAETRVVGTMVGGEWVGETR